ncbi:hypothetical protein Cci01nite_37000 [Catellatospora citrea]|uniref:Uncharacterized protein n=1 Tax=Catellatospora citrea TaxID=53366 RepID=A0A8J3P082_9ACTN|nr:hypothetical protein Cci01nite_37000 [Catellatospora citrea]
MKIVPAAGRATSLANIRQLHTVNAQSDRIVKEAARRAVNAQPNSPTLVVAAFQSSI